MGSDQSRSKGRIRPDKPNDERSGSARRLVMLAAMVLGAWGAVVSLALLVAMFHGHCGMHGRCGDRGRYATGPWGVIAALFLADWRQPRDRHIGPQPFMAILYALVAGAVVVFAWPAFSPAFPWRWRVFTALLALLAAGLLGWLVHQTVRNGVREVVRRIFWLQSSEQVGKTRHTYRYPPTRDERVAAAAMAGHILIGLGVGTALGFAFL